MSAQFAGPAPAGTPAALAQQVLQAVRASGLRAPIVLIDGPSGSGKSTLADAVLEAWPGPQRPQLVRLDDLYPGWNGLQRAADHVVAELLQPLRSNGIGRWRRWDWAADAAAEWQAIDAAHPLIVEGCGALSRAAGSLADVRVWLAADDELRKTRALVRDAGAFDAHWEMWDAQFRAFVRAEHPEALADLVLATAPDPI